MPSEGHRTADPVVASPTPPVRRPRHLLDPSDLGRSHRSRQSSQESLTKVQRWVMSVLAGTTILHFAGGLVLAAVFMDEPQRGARFGLIIIAAIIGMLGVATGRLIHARSPITPWVLLGLLPALVGFWVLLT
jgi:hypothetical protein